MARKRVPWATYIKPMLGDGTFKGRFRMGHDDFMVLVDLLREDIERDTRMGELRNGAIPVEYQVAMTLRWLAGASIYEGMDGHVIARSSAYATAHRVIDALNACSALDCKWPVGDEVAREARLFKERSSWDVIDKAFGAMDGLFIRLIKPNFHEHAATHAFFSGHKKAFGMNFQGICNANYEIIAWTMNCPGSQNDRTAFKFSGFPKLLKDVPPGYYILGDAAYPASDRVLVPFPGTALSASQDAFNFFQSQCRISIEQTFGIMVRRWGILWRPIEVRLERFNAVVNAVVRCHNFCRSRVIDVPTDNVEITVPAGVQFDAQGRISNDFFRSERPRGRRAADQASISAPREAIRQRLEVEGIVRPRYNIARNQSRLAGR